MNQFPVKTLAALFLLVVAGSIIALLLAMHNFAIWMEGAGKYNDYLTTIFVELLFVGLIGAMNGDKLFLLYIFVIKAWATLFYKEEK